MGIFKKKKNNLNDGQNQSQFEQRQPNHWAFDDDPLLNIEPVFENSPEADANSLTMKNIQSSNINRSENINIARPNLNTNNQSINNRSNSPLSGIINDAIQKSGSLKQEIIDNDPVIAKLNKIEEMRSSGKVDESVYTDLSKSSSSKAYAQKASEFAKQNTSSNINARINETAIERARRLEEKARKLRDGSTIDNTDQNLAINSTMIQRRIRNNQNAFAINLDKKQFYIQNTNLERAKAAQAERKAKEISQSLNPAFKNKNQNNYVEIELDNKLVNELNVEENNNLVNNSNIEQNNIELVSQKFENEVSNLEQELFSALQKWQQHQIDKINKMISTKVNQINEKSFESEEQKIKYLKNKIKHLYNSINKGKVNS